MKTLQNLGFSMVLPREKLSPLSLIRRKSRNIFQIFKKTEGSLLNAELKDLFIAHSRGVEYPKIQSRRLPISISGIENMSSKSRILFGLLQDINPSATGNLEHAKHISFDFREAEEKFVNLFILDDYIKYSSISSEHNAFISDLKNNKIFIIISILSSKRLSLKIDFANTVSSEISAPFPTLLDSIEAEASISSKKDFIVENDDDTLRTFAIKTARILYKNGTFCIKDEEIIVRSSKDINLDASDDEIESEILFD